MRSKLKAFERLILEWKINNFIRFTLMQRPMRLSSGTATRTPAQQRRQFKRKRIHREWKIKKCWRRRNGMSWWRSVMRKIREEVRGHADQQFANLVSTTTMFLEIKMKKTGR